MAVVDASHFDGMDDETFMAEWTEFGAKVAEDRESLKAYSAEHQKRERLKALNITPADLELLQSVTPDQIVSSEEVGEPGKVPPPPPVNEKSEKDS